ncbi:MAG: HDOD domain-containing protein [gamma proteobacterium symbiont of Taylorina sp.]|nr:HDOD domain-containing protein [gamma proteobacterium symbiont of Taylorina sp.]
MANKAELNTQLSQFINRSDIAALPVLHNTLQELKETLAKPSFNYHHLDAILQYDPACMINLLSYANKEINKDFDKQISKVEHAAMFLGMDRLEKFINNISSVYSIKNRKVAEKINRLQYRGIHAAFQAKNLALLINDSAIDEIYTSALISPLSELMCWFLEPVKAQKVELLVHHKNRGYAQAQLEIFGFSYHELAQALTLHWNIPTLFLQRQEVDSIEDMSKPVKCIYFAEKCSLYAEKGWYYDAMYKHIDYCSDNLHYSKGRIVQAFHKTAIHLAHTTKRFYKIQSVSAYLALLPGEVPYTQVIEIEEKKKTALSKSQNKLSDITINKADSIKIESINFIKTVNNFPSLIRITMDALYETEAFSRVAFIMLTKDKKNLQVRSLRGAKNKVFIETKLPLQPANLFSKLLEKPQFILINSQNYQKFSPIINKTMQNMLDSQEFIARSIHSKDKPIGLFYIDNHTPKNQDEKDSVSTADMAKIKEIYKLFDKQLTIIT